MKKEVKKENAAKVTGIEVQSIKALIPSKCEGKTLCVCTLTKVGVKEGKFGANYVLEGDCFMKSPEGIVVNAKKLYVPYAMNEEFAGREAEYKGRRLVFTVCTERVDGKLRMTGYIKTSGFDSGGVEIPPEMLA